MPSWRRVGPVKVYSLLNIRGLCSCAKSQFRTSFVRNFGANHKQERTVPIGRGQPVRRGNLNLLMGDAAHTPTSLAHCRTVPVKQGATCDRDRPAGEWAAQTDLLPGRHTVRRQHLLFQIKDRRLPALAALRDSILSPGPNARSSPSTAMPEREPDLNRKLAHTIKPTRGPATQLVTLADCAPSFPGPSTD